MYATTRLSSGTHKKRGGSAPAPLALDPPINTALSSKAYHAFGFDRMVEGYVGNSVRLKRLSDNAQSDFGFNSTTGLLDLATVNTWRSTANVDVVKFYDQTGRGGEFVADSTVAFIRSDAVKRFGTTWAQTNSALTRSATDGAVGADLAGTGCFYLTGSSIAQSTTGLEIQILKSTNTRKNVAGVDALGSNYTEENMLSYGIGSNSRLRFFWYLNFGYYCQLYVNSPAIDESDIGQSPNILKQYGQDVLGMRLTGTQYYFDTHMADSGSKTLGATAQTYMAGAPYDNGKLVIGAHFSNAGGTTYSASNRGDFILGGVIITQALTAKERYLVKSKLGAVGQQHRIKTKAEIEAYFDELIYLKDTNTGTGVIAGSKGQTSLTFAPNGSANAGGTSTYNLDADDAICGLNGVYSDSKTNLANGWIASNSYFAGVSAGTIMSFHRLDAQDSDLYTPVTLGNASPYVSSLTDRALTLGFDHDKPSVMTMVASSRDTETRSGSRKKGDNSAFAYDMANQAKGKYNRNVHHGAFTYGETFGGYVLTQAFWTNTDGGGAGYTLDAATGPDINENMAFWYKSAVPLLQIATFQAPVGYNRNDAYNTRKAYFLQSINKSYLGLIGAGVGHVQSDIAINANGCVVESRSDATLRSSHFNAAWKGSLFLFGFSTTVFTQTQIEEVQTNLYKLVS